MLLLLEQVGFFAAIRNFVVFFAFFPEILSVHIVQELRRVIKVREKLRL